MTNIVDEAPDRETIILQYRLSEKGLFPYAGNP